MTTPTRTASRAAARTTARASARTTTRAAARTSWALLGAALVLAPDVASACPMCISAQDDAVQTAFALASLFMTAMPLSAIGGLIWWLRRKARQLAAEEAAGVIRLPLPVERARSRE